MKPVSGEELRRTIAPKASDIVRIWLLLVIVVAGLGSASAVIAFHAYQKGDLAKMFEFIMLCLGTTVIAVLAGMMEIRKVQVHNYVKEQRLAALSDDMLMMLADEISQTELRYGTFYFLDSYVYFPHAGSLIHYVDIAQWRMVSDQFFGFTDHIWVEITEADGFVQRISIRHWRRYLKDADRVVEEMEQRKWDAV